MSANLIRKFADKIKLKPPMLAKILNFWSPFRGAGIRVARINDSFTEVDVEMKLSWFNQNYVGTHFGGSLYAMTDPFYMLMLMHNVGRDYIVWDIAASIQFKKPGKGRVRAEFRYTPEEIAAAKQAADNNEKYVFKKIVYIKNDLDEIVAEVEKSIYIKRKR